MSSPVQHEVKAAGAVIHDDVICQTFIQSSSTLAYACLLMRRKKYELAAHLLHSLEARHASRFKDMVFYLQAQIGIENGDYAVVKKRLVPRINQHPNDTVALSLLENAIHLEWVAWKGRQVQASEPAAAPATSEAAGIPDSASAQQPVSSKPASGTVQVTPPAEAANPAHASPDLQTDAVAGDFGVYQGLAAEEATQALAVGNPQKQRCISTCRNGELTALIALLPQILPGDIAPACQALEGGEIHKVCYSFQNLTVTSLHAGSEYLALVTGNINQSLLTMVRAENLFQKQATTARERQASLPLEARSHG